MQPIQIELVNGQIVCSRARGKVNEQIQWKCQHPFTVDFGWESPVKDQNNVVESLAGVLDAPSNTYWTSSNAKIVADADKKGGPLRFKYTIALWDTNNVFIEDPEIIIDP